MNIIHMSYSAMMIQKKIIKERWEIQNIQKLLIMSSFLPLSRNPVEHSSLHLEHMLYELFVYKSHSKTID